MATLERWRLGISAAGSTSSKFNVDLNLFYMVSPKADASAAGRLLMTIDQMWMAADNDSSQGLDLGLENRRATLAEVQGRTAVRQPA